MAAEDLDITNALRYFLDVGMLLPLAIGVGLAAAFTLWWHRRHAERGRPWLTFAAALAIAGIGMFTLARDGIALVGALSNSDYRPPGLPGLLEWSAEGWQRVSTNPFASSEVMLNVALFVPAGFFLTLWLRRPGL